MKGEGHLTVLVLTLFVPSMPVPKISIIAHTLISGRVNTFEHFFFVQALGLRRSTHLGTQSLYTQFTWLKSVMRFSTFRHVSPAGNTDTEWPWFRSSAKKPAVGK
jgi:hypothetical protein